MSEGCRDREQGSLTPLGLNQPWQMSERPMPFQGHFASKANTMAPCIASHFPVLLRRKDGGKGVITPAPQSLKHLQIASGCGSQGV